MTIISRLEDVTLHNLDVVHQAAVTWVLQKVKGEMETTIGIKSTSADNTNSHRQEVKPFFSSLKDITKPVEFSRCCVIIQIFLTEKYQTHQHIIQYIREEST